MRGIKWKELSEGEFTQIVNSLLQRIHPTGYAPEGRGGDGGRDFTVDNDRIIYQYKFLPLGTLGQSQRRQVKRSFIAAMNHKPESWRLIIPAQILDSFRRYVFGLAEGHDVEISIHDAAWLDSELANRPDLAEYFMYRSTPEFVMCTDRLADSPFVRTGRDVASHVSRLKQEIDAADPDWTWDVFATGHDQTHVLRAKHHNANVTSPIRIDLTARPAENERFETEIKYGVTQALRLASAEIANFTVVGPPIVAFNGQVEFLEIRPMGDGESDWMPAEIQLIDSGEVLASAHLGRTRFRASGTEGYTLELELASGLLTCLLRCPADSRSTGQVNLTVAPLASRNVGDALEVARVLRALASSDGRLDFYANGRRCFRMSTLPTVGRSFLLDEHVLELAEDLSAIEAHTPHRFHLPSEITNLERIRIRLARLLLDGKTTAWPATDDLVLKCSATGAADLLESFTDEPRWIVRSETNQTMEVLGKTIHLGEVHWGAQVSIHPNDRARLTGATTGEERVRLTLLPGDCWRTWLPDRLASDDLTLTPWAIPSIEEPAKPTCVFDDPARDSSR